MEDPARLARAVKDARGHLTQNYVANRAHEKGYPISVQSWRNIEQQRTAQYRESTLLAVDAGLDWDQGTAKSILNGEEPPERQHVDSDLAARLARIEARLAGATELTALDAAAIILSRLDDEQYTCLAQAVSQDPRFESVGA